MWVYVYETSFQVRVVFKELKGLGEQQDTLVLKGKADYPESQVLRVLSVASVWLEVQEIQEHPALLDCRECKVIIALNKFIKSLKSTGSVQTCRFAEWVSFMLFNSNSRNVPC